LLVFGATACCFISSGFYTEAGAGFLRSSIYRTRENSYSYCWVLPISASEIIADDPVPAAIIYNEVASYSNPISHVYS